MLSAPRRRSCHASAASGCGSPSRSLPGLTWNVATGAVIPFFGPVLAVQFLILGAGPLPLSKAVAFVGLVLVVGQGFIFLNGLFGDHPIQLLILLGLFYFVCFFVQARGQGGPVIFLCLTIAIVGYPAGPGALDIRSCTRLNPLLRLGLGEEASRDDGDHRNPDVPGKEVGARS